MKATICDFCEKPIKDADGKDAYWILSIELANSPDQGIPTILDCCRDCYLGSVILSEMRRVRTHRKKAGKGRKARTTTKGNGIEIDKDSAVSLGLEADHGSPNL